ncbi:MAG: four helix bundle protein [Vicinamibacterales bacterium]
MAPVLRRRGRMTPGELRTRIDRFADDTIALCRVTASDPLILRLLVQLQDAAASTAANYRAACRAQSKAAFVAKLSIALEEADESVGWLQRLSRQQIGAPADVERLPEESTEIAAILSASRQTAQGRRRRSTGGTPPR